MKTVFVVMSAEFFHPGHLNIIKTARELGEVTVGLATDEFNGRYKRLSVLSYEQRKAIVENIMGVKRVVPQETLDLEPALRELKPDYFVHGDDWKTGPLASVRRQVVDLLAEWGGVLVEPAYTEGISSTKLNAAWRSIGATPESRIRHFRRLLAYQPLVRILEVHSGLAGLIVERTRVRVEGKPREFDAMWFSALTDALAKGKADDSYVDFTSQLNTIHEILEETTKPLIVEGRHGGTVEQFTYMVKTLERVGVSAVVIGNGAKSENITSLDANGRVDPHETAAKISAGKKAQVSIDFSIIARINFLRQKAKEASLEAQAYITAGTDAVMVQSSPKQSGELLKFCRLFTNSTVSAPLLAALPSGSALTEQQLVEAGVQLVVYSDQLLRTAQAAMVKTAETLLQPDVCH